MEDRLQELQRQRESRQTHSSVHEAHHGTEPSGAAVAVTAAERGVDMDEFVKVQNHIKRIRDCTTRLRSATSKQGSSAEVNQIMEEATNAIQLSSEHVKAFYKSADNDMKKQQATRLKNEFSTEFNAFQDAKEQHKKAFINKVVQQSKIVSPGIKEAEVVEMLESENIQVFQDQLLLSGEEKTRHQEAKKAYDYISSQYEDLKRLDENMQKLLQLFIEVQQIVEISGVQLDDTLMHIEVANEEAGDAVKHIQEGKKAQSAKIKRRICFGCCVAGTAAVAAGGVAAVASSDAAKVGMLAACIIM